MPPPDPHYTLLLINHETGKRLKIELPMHSAVPNGTLPTLIRKLPALKRWAIIRSDSLNPHRPCRRK
jgi:hypothetical protein